MMVFYNNVLDKLHTRHKGTACNSKTLLLLFLFVIGLGTRIEAIKCVDDTLEGPGPNLNLPYTDTGQVRHRGYMDSYNIIDCYGAIKRWSFAWRIFTPADCYDVAFQVWRPVSGTSFQLIGQSVFTPDHVTQCVELTTASPLTTTEDVVIITDFETITEATTITTTTMAPTTTTTPPQSVLVSLSLTLAEHIPVIPGDRFGWTDLHANTSERRIPFDTALDGSATYPQMYILPSDPTTITGDVTDWSAAIVATLPVRGYAMDVTLTAREPPYIVNLPNTTPVSVIENQATGEYIYTVRGMNGYSYDPVVLPDLTYNMSSTSPCSDYFTLDPITGIVTTKMSLDYEDIFANNPAPDPFLCELTVCVHEGPYSSASHILTVQILDDNEAHEFVDTSIVWLGPFNVNQLPSGKVVYTVDIRDDDDPLTPKWWPHKTFMIQDKKPEDAPFKIESHVYNKDPLYPLLIHNESFGAIVTTKDLALWQEPLLVTLYVTASDGYHVTGPLQINIELTNIRDNPVLTNLPTTISVLEGSSLPIQLYKVTGEAEPPPPTPLPPAPRRTDIKYKITAVYPITADVRHFILNAITGVLSYSGPMFDHFGINPYHVEMVAYYNMSPPYQQSQPQNLTIVIDWRNTAPYFIDDRNMSATVRESEPIGSTLPGVVLGAADRDVTNGDWIHYILSGDGSHLFAPNNVTNLVHVSRSLTLPPNNDFVTYVMWLYVLDSHGNYSEKVLTVKVTDVNDHVPITNAVSYLGQVQADTKAPLYTGVTINTVDQDGPINADLAYIVMDSVASEYFEVNATSGDVFTRQPIPYDTYRDFTFVVFITDRGRPIPLNTSVQVRVDVTEKNVNTPEFLPSFDSKDLRADTDLNVVVYTVYAYDNDSSLVNTVSYYLWSIPDYFNLETTSGKVYVSRPLVPYRKELIHIYARDNANHKSPKPFVLRIDTYDAVETLVDVYLHCSLDYFARKRDEFLAALNSVATQWDIRIESVRSNDEGMIVTVYAVESAAPDLPDNHDMQKVFIHENVLVDFLTTNLKGDPIGELQGPEFDPAPYKVAPRYPDWVTDTPGGVATITLITLLAAAGLIAMAVLLAKKFGNKFYRSPRPRSPKVGPTKDDFKLSYIPEGQAPIYYSRSNPNPTVSPFSSMRTSLGEYEATKTTLPPVSIDDRGRPLPRSIGGTAA